jgi:hypothetical protein
MRLNHNLGWTVVASHRNTIGSTAWASRAFRRLCAGRPVSEVR